jgi:hypothetical protein
MEQTDPYRDNSFSERNCDYCGEPYRGPSVLLVAAKCNARFWPPSHHIPLLSCDHGGSPCPRDGGHSDRNRCPIVTATMTEQEFSTIGHLPWRTSIR